MTQSSVAAPKKQAAKAANISNQVAELAAVTNSIITNITGQADVNEALTKRLLSLDDRISQLEARMQAPAPAPATAAAAAQPAAQTQAPSNLRDLVLRAAQGQNATKAIYLGDHLALAQVLDRFKMYVDTRDIGIAPHLMMGGQWEMWVTKLFCDLLRPGMTVVDVGANFGYYTLLAASAVHLDSHVHAIEADPHNFEILNKNVEVNGYQNIVKTYNCAALNVRRDVTFHQYQNHFGSNGIFSDPADPRIASSVQVPGIPLDELITTPVDLMKIDAEGCEPLIFEGMQGLIQRSPNIQILMEFAPHMIRATIDPVEFLTRIRRTGLTVKGVSYDAKVEVWPDERLLTPDIHTSLPVANIATRLGENRDRRQNIMPLYVIESNALQQKLALERSPEAASAYGRLGPRPCAAPIRQAADRTISLCLHRSGNFSRTERREAERWSGWTGKLCWKALPETIRRTLRYSGRTSFVTVHFPCIPQSRFAGHPTQISYAGESKRRSRGIRRSHSDVPGLVEIRVGHVQANAGAVGAIVSRAVSGSSSVRIGPGGTRTGCVEMRNCRRSWTRS